MQWDEPIVRLALYAAGISTIALIWNIINAIRKNKIKLKVDLHFLQSFIGIPALGTTGPVIPLIKARIVNQGAIERFIYNPTLEFSKKIKLMGIESKLIEAKKKMVVINTQ